jgi:hypothetical protein
MRGRHERESFAADATARELHRGDLGKRHSTRPSNHPPENVNSVVLMAADRYKAAL